MDRKTKKTILHVEDDISIRTTIGFILNNEGYVVYAASNGQEALNFLSSEKGKIDFIILDVMMPVMDGFAFCGEQIKDEAIAHIPTLIYSADERNRLKAQAIGKSFLSKPFDIDDLIEEIEK